MGSTESGVGSGGGSNKQGAKERTLGVYGEKWKDMMSLSLNPSQV